MTAIAAQPTAAATLQKQTVTQKFKILDIKAAEVSFSGVALHPVAKDDSSGDYTAPHWQDNSSPPNGTGTDAGDRRFPVSYTGGSKITASARLRIKPDPPTGTDVRLRALGPGFDFPAKAAAASPGFLDYPATEATAALGAGVGFLNPMVLNWQVSVDGGVNWRKAGQTGNRVYITLADPQAAPLFETLLDISGRNAAGKTTAVAAAGSIWSDFFAPLPGVKRKLKDGFNNADGVEMRYWAEADGTAASASLLNFIGSFCQTVPGMLGPGIRADVEGVGNCAAWSDLFVESLLAQGITGAQVYQVRTATSPFRRSSDPGLMLVKTWNFSGTGSATPGCFQFNYLASEVQDDPTGAPGQGVHNPPGGFFNHFIVNYAGQWYDPSYGNGPFASQTAWEDGSLSGVEITCASTGERVTKKRQAGQPPDTIFTIRGAP